MAEAIMKLGPGLLTLGATGTKAEFGGLTSEVKLSPEYNADDPIPVLSGEEIDGEDKENWTLSFTKFQDYSEKSLDLWLYQNAGKVLDFTFVPSKDGKLQAKGRVKIRAASIGGEVKKKNTNEVELPVIGRPDVTGDYAGE